MQAMKRSAIVFWLVYVTVVIRKHGVVVITFFYFILIISMVYAVDVFISIDEKLVEMNTYTCGSI